MNEGGHRVQMRMRIEAAPDAVFPYLTEADRYTRWQGSRAELDPRPGGVYRVWMDPGTVVVGEFVEVTPPSDHAGVTALAAERVAVELLAGTAAPRQARPATG